MELGGPDVAPVHGGEEVDSIVGHGGDVGGVVRGAVEGIQEVGHRAFKQARAERGVRGKPHVFQPI